MKNLVLYIHGKGGNAGECEHYRPLFPASDVAGLDYPASFPREAGERIRAAVLAYKGRYESVTLIANSVGAYFSMCAGIDPLIRKAFFVSPIVDMERLIRDMMGWAKVTEDELRTKGVIPTPFGEDLSWEYLSYVRAHPVQWRAPTSILYGARDSLTSLETVSSFAEAHHASLTVMEDGEHWFHTEEQMAFLDRWIGTGG